MPVIPFDPKDDGAAPADPMPETPHPQQPAEAADAAEPDTPPAPDAGTRESLTDFIERLRREHGPATTLVAPAPVAAGESIMMRLWSRVEPELALVTGGKRVATDAEISIALRDNAGSAGIVLAGNKAAIPGDKIGRTPVSESDGSQSVGAEDIAEDATTTEGPAATALDLVSGNSLLARTNSGGIAVPVPNSYGQSTQLREADASEALELGDDNGFETAGDYGYSGAPAAAAPSQHAAPQARVPGRRMMAPRKPEHDAKHGLFWHFHNIFSGRNWDGSRDEAYEARAEAERATADSFISAIRKVDKAATETKLSPRFYYVENPPMSFFDYPMEPTRVGVAQVNLKGAALATLDLATVLPWGKAMGFFRGDLAAADEGSVHLVPRLGPKGVQPARHNANVLVSDSQGRIVTHQRLVSGHMTAEEKALGFPKNMLATHTEARAVRGIHLQRGDTVIITGQLPPCTPCRGSMNQAATQSGATIKYQWRQGGKTLTWVATPKRK